MLLFTTALVLTLLIFVVFYPGGRVARNQHYVVGLLESARANGGSPDTYGVSLQNGKVVLPGRELTTSGYVLRLEPSHGGYSIEAHPIRRGGTGLLSFFRDTGGVIRFESGAKRADASSKPF